jgi:Abortive infection alpha
MKIKMGELNLKSSTIEKSLDLVKDFLQKLIGPSIDELGLLFSDNVKLWRLKNQIRNLEKVKKIVDEEKIDIKQVNLKVLIPYLEGVSLEDDETLQNLWAKLFTNYIDTSKNLTINVYPNILKQLSTNEVTILRFLQSNGNKLTFKGYNANKVIKFTSEELSNLERLGLIKETLEISQYGGDIDESTGQWKWDFEELASGEYYITDFGFEFLNACER